MSAAPSIMSLSGTLADVASFFRVSRRTVVRWNAERPPRIAHWKDGHNLTYGEEGIVAYRAAGYRASGRLAPGEAVEIARREWREHIRARVLADGHDLADGHKEAA